MESDDNTTLYTRHVFLEDLKMDSNMMWLIGSLVSALVWIIYITFYNSRVFGYIVTHMVNKCISKGTFFKLGSITVSPIAGKLMFRDFVYIQSDYTVRIQDGYLIFRWWRSYIPKDASEDLSHSDTRLSIMLNGFELHVYNRTQLYGKLEKTFGLDPSLLFPNDSDYTSEINLSEKTLNASERIKNAARKSRPEATMAKTWRDLIPVIKLDIVSGRVVFGNRLVPTTLSIGLEEAHLLYSTKPAASPLDYLMHFVKCQADNCKVMLANSPNYTGMIDEPPRFMGEGFVIMSSNYIELYFYMDEPGIVPEQPGISHLANGDIVEPSLPMWGVDIKCGKGTDFSYGPWADRQRDHLFNFFFPNDWQTMKATKLPKPGERRQMQNFDIRLSTLNEATIDILFSKNKETNAVHVNIGAGSYLDITLPWMVEQTGFTTKLNGQLLHLEASTSLQYRSLAESETLEFSVKCHYPLKWNQHQDWSLHLTGCKATAHLIYSHKEFFQDLVNDWASKQRPDLLTFVPYTWKFSLLLKEFEIITMSNEYNWIDCSSTHQENCHLAFCGDLFDFSFDLPFKDFLPQTIPLRFWIQGEGLDLSLYLPEISTSRPILLALNSNAKILSRNGTISCSSFNAKKWRKICQNNNGWIDCWSVPIIALSINYIYHPRPPLGPDPQADITTPEKEEILLSPMRIPKFQKSPVLHWKTQPGIKNFDPQALPPDKISLELEIGPSVLLAYGSVLRNFIHLKENIFGDCQIFTDMHQNCAQPSDKTASNNSDSSTNPPEINIEFHGSQKNQFDPRIYRPLDVVVNITMHDIQAHLVKNCNPEDPPCPVIIIERLGFEMHKTFRETRLQLLLSPSILICADNNIRMNKDKHLQQGHLMLSALQVRGDAMFSNEGCSLDDETLEYAWLVEIQLGKFSGKLTLPQLCHIITGLETMVLLVIDAENCLRPPSNVRLCHHGTVSELCTHSISEIRYRCPCSEDIKYRMIRLAIDAIDLYLIEHGTALHTWISPIRLSTCNLHGKQVKSGITGMLPLILIRQFISADSHFSNSYSNTNTTSSGRSNYTYKEHRGYHELSEHWLEVGSMSFGPVIIEAATSLPSPEHSLHIVQHKFLKTHDNRTKRLWFLWDSEEQSGSNKIAENPHCGCLGGCAFFGSNKNGPRFFKPKPQDKDDGINVAVFCINESNEEIGFGQSLLHEGQLIFRTAPYNMNNIILQESAIPYRDSQRLGDFKLHRMSMKEGKSTFNSKQDDINSVNNKLNASKQVFSSIAHSDEWKVKGRRFSCTSAKSSVAKACEVPYGRLKENELSNEYDSRELSSSLQISQENYAPKSSASDSRLAVDYFAITTDEGPINCIDRENTNVLESELLLNVSLDTQHKLKQNVQRTISMTSDSHSEAFFSADEDLTTSRTASLRHSALTTEQFNTNRNNRKKCASDLSITNLDKKMEVKRELGVSDGISRSCQFGRKATKHITHCSDHEINSNVLLNPRKMTDGENFNNHENMDSSDSKSASSSSFISALSSQEDITLVNLHMQGNKPIIDSPLLMASYVTHLTQVRCSNWLTSSLPYGTDAFSIPVFRKNNEGYMVYTGSRYLPHFDTVTEGLSTLRMVDRSESSPSTRKTPQGLQSHPYTWDSSILLTADNESEPDHIGEGAENDKEFLTCQTEAVSRSTCIVRFKSGVDIMITPLVLEGLQRLIDSLTSTLASLHVLTVVNHLHASCVGKVQDANILKKDESLSYWSQIHSSSKHSTSERQVSGTGPTEEYVQTNVYEECISTQLQGIIIFPKINITIFQTSVVEELISFAALDNIQDLTCASLLAVCLENVTLRCHIGKQAKEVVQTLSRPTAPSCGLKKVTGLMRGPRAFISGNLPSRASQDALPSEPDYIETSEMQQEELLVTLNVGRIHAQLRRLRNESTILKDAIITSIPTHCSRVLFTCARISSPVSSEIFYQQSNQNENIPLKSFATDIGCSNVNLQDNSIGFIMFECGLEGVSIKIVKRSQRDNNENGQGCSKSREREPLYDASVHSKQSGDNVKTENNINNTPIPESKPNQNERSGSAPTLTSNKKNATSSIGFDLPDGNQNKNTLKDDNGKTSSCVIEFKTVWFNFAAPPRAPITRKLDFTRLDWNLLSTASSAINAWMNPSNRFFIKAMTMCKSMYRRRTAVVVCLMADALDVPSIHIPVKSRYGKLTPLAKTLQEDPSCQLCCVLQKYVLLGEVKAVENNLRESELPILSILREGVIVLSRQWKNVLYTPLLLEHKYKTKLVRPINITISIPETDEENFMDEPEVEGTELTDECATLLNNNKTKHDLGDQLQPPNGMANNMSGGAAKTNPNIIRQVATIDKVLISPSLKSGTGYGTLCEEQNGSVGSVCSSGESVNLPCSSLIASNERSVSISATRFGEDLYSWMAKQDTKGNYDNKLKDLIGKTEVRQPIDNMVSSGVNMFSMHDSLKLLDAHMIFEPLLTCLGVMPQKMLPNVTEGSDNLSSLDALGTKLSLIGSIDILRIDIVVSESKTDKKKSKFNSKPKGHKFVLKIPPETPAFICEKMGVQLELNKIADVSIDEAVRRQSVLYLSRGQLRKHTSTILNFSLNINYIAQQINMPLLRLLHQISNMYQNVKNAQNELREQHADMKNPTENGISEDIYAQPREASSLVSANNDHLSSHTLIGSLDKSIILDAPISNFNNQVSDVVISHSVSAQKVCSFTSQLPISQSPSFRIRPQSLAQKLRSTSKTVKGKLGYTNLNEGTRSSAELRNDSFSNSGMERITAVSEKGQSKSGIATMIPAPNCWKTVYYLLDLYATQPDTKTIPHRFSVAPDISEHFKNIRKFNISETKSQDDIAPGDPTTSTPIQTSKEPGIFGNERARWVVFGIARIHRTRLLATLSGLKLEAEITSLQSSLTCKKRLHTARIECSLTGQVGKTMIVLLEGVAPNQQTVVKVTAGKSQTLYSSISKKNRNKNSGLLTVGAINIDIPQHPVALHGMMTRGSKQLSSTLQELRVVRTSGRISRTGGVYHTEDTESSSVPHQQPGKQSPMQMNDNIHAKKMRDRSRALDSAVGSSGLLQPLVMQFLINLESLSITAALLPSLQAQYKMDKVQSTGVTGSKAKFTIDLPQHSLSFNTKIQASEANLPSEASISLPQVHVGAEYILEGDHQEAPNKESLREETRNIDGLILCQGSYLNATADIGAFEHSLTTDMLNHLVFVQKVFMKEVNEVVQKVYGGEKPVPLWLEDHDEASTTAVKQILFSLVIRIKRVQLTATTPTNSAVRLETGAVDFQLSNRVRNVSVTDNSRVTSTLKLFGKAQVDINLSLGQLHRNVIFEEAEPEFQQFAFFNTRIALRNAFQDEMAREDMEVVLITLKRPLIYIQPMAVDRAILVWLNYKNAYEYWNENRANLNKEVLTATQQVLEKVQFGQLSAPHLSTLFLQLTVEDMGICLPINPPPLSSWTNRGIFDYDSKGAVVVTLENTSISACSSGSLVSKGKFVGLCLRFTDDFEASLDDWKPDMNDSNIMNLCVVSEGTYEVCSRTIAAKQGVENAKWFLNVQWQMEGVDIHLDVNVGKQLSALGHTLTMLTGSEEEDQMIMDSDSDDGQKVSQENIMVKNTNKWMDSLPAFVFDPNIDAKQRSKLIEKEMNEQAKIIHDLRTLGASQGTIEHEMRRLHELETLIFKDFRRDMIKKLRRQSMRTTAIKDKLGYKQYNSLQAHDPFTVNPSVEQTIPINSSTLESIASGDIGGDSSRGGPSRSVSLKVRGQQRVTFGDAPHVLRQSSLPGTNSVVNVSESDPNWILDSAEENIVIDGTPVQMRRKSPQAALSSIDIKNSDSTKAQKQQEPNIDFELDVKVLINSGKCVLHTKDLAKEEEMKMKIKKERSNSAAGLDVSLLGSPITCRRQREKASAAPNSKLRSNHAYVSQLADLTIFHIPGLDVKVHYESKTLPEECSYSRASYAEGISFFGRKPGTKRASLFAWTTLQSIPEETVISPHILEFLEQTLEPIPTKPNLATTSGQINSRVTMNDVSDYGQYVYTSFPVDVIVYFHMQPSTFRFSCLPISRVECMLQLPSLDIVFSSKRQEEELCNEFGGFGSNAAAIGGLSVTGCLADFSVYIFHPYGGKKSGIKEAQCSPLSDTERKDSLSINVEFVKFHLSRSRKLTQTDKSRAVIRFSTIIDIGSASFKYDMRRLTEILAFPKAWYRRSIVRHLFLGDLSMQSQYMDDAFTDDVKSIDKFCTSLLSITNDKTAQKEKLNLSFENDLPKHIHLEELPDLANKGTTSAWETLVLFAVNFTKLSVQMNMGNVMGNVMWMTKDFRSHGRLSIGSTGHKNMYLGFGLGGSSLDAKGGIVGGTIELSQINTHVHIREEAGSEPDHVMGVCLLALELRLDYMGTSAVMARISRLDAELRDEWRRERCASTVTRRPATIFIHNDLRWDQLQLMISKSTTVDLLKMYHKLEEFFSQQFKSSKRVFSSLQPRAFSRSTMSAGPASSQSVSAFNRHKLTKKKLPSSGDSKESWGLDIQEARHHRHWQTALRLVSTLAKSSLKIPLPVTGTVLGGTMQLRGSNISLACFHGINFKCRSWALFSLQEPCIDFSTESQEIHSTDGFEDQRVHVVQTLTFGLGVSESELKQRKVPPPVQHRSMATVCRISRNVIFPPQYKTPQEWFHYAFAGSDIDAVDRFPIIERDKTEAVSNSSDRSRGVGISSSNSSKLSDLNHTREVIFALPSLHAHLKTEHLQTSTTPDNIAIKPVVQCSFITEFEDHIFVTVDAEAFFFLHDLITSYVKEKERVSGLFGARSNSPDPRTMEQPSSSQSTPGANAAPGNVLGDDRKKRVFDPADMFTKDWRDFNCKTWHLEPTVRLLSWAGKSIEPYGVDYILQKLGFSHARTTIPKWMQRGFMDPLDKLLSVLMTQLIKIVREDSQQKT